MDGKERIPKPGEKEIKPGKIRIRPTRPGWVFTLALAAMLWGASNYGDNLGFLFTFLLAGTAFVSLFHTHANIKRVRPGRVNARPVFAGQKAVFAIGLKVIRDKRAYVELGLGGEVSEPAVLSREKEAVPELGLRTRSRGWLKPGKLRIQSSHPFGLFKAWTEHEVKARCLVYPNPIPGELLFGGRGAEQGEGEPAGPGADDFKEIRPYRPGDSVQRIAWKSSSRGRGLFIKEFEAVKGSSALLDWEMVKGGIEERLSRLCAMVLEAERRGLGYGLRLPGREIEPGRGEEHMGRCLKELALYGRDREE